MAKDTKVQNAPITGTVPASLREAIEDYRWKNRLTVSEVVREAIEVWAKSKGIDTTASAPTSESAPAEDKRAASAK